MARNLQGMIVAITGASAGIGKALAEKLSATGAKLALCARRVDRLEELNRQLGGGHLCVQADVGKMEDCERFIRQTAEHFGRIDTLVCNAGYGSVRTVADATHDEIRQMFETNVFGTTDCIRAAVPVMRKQELRDGWRGQVMIVSSAAAKRGLPFFGHYSATKAAQLSIAEALRVELKRDHIAVTSIHPVGTNTEFFDTAEKQTGLRRPTTDTKVRQSAETVARKMVRAIERPTTEMWPLRASRWALNLQAFVPGLTDWVMSRYYRQIEEINRK